MKDKRKNVEPEFQLGDLVATVDFREKLVTESDRTNCSDDFYVIVEVFDDNIPTLLCPSRSSLGS